MVDIQAGLLPQERQLANRLIKDKSRIIFVANKADSERLRMNAHEADWHKLGLGEPFPVSVLNGSNVGNLLDEVLNVSIKGPATATAGPRFHSGGKNQEH